MNQHKLIIIMQLFYFHTPNAHSAEHQSRGTKMSTMKFILCKLCTWEYMLCIAEVEIPSRCS